MGWKMAMRKVILMTFGQNTLATSCAVGRRDAKTTCTSLDKVKLNTIKGTNHYICALEYI